MAENHDTEIELIPVKAEDIIGERRSFYDAFTRSIPFAAGITALLLVGIYLLWG